MALKMFMNIIKIKEKNFFYLIHVIVLISKKMMEIKKEKI